MRETRRPTNRSRTDSRFEETPPRRKSQNQEREFWDHYEKIPSRPAFFRLLKPILIVALVLALCLALSRFIPQNAQAVEDGGKTTGEQYAAMLANGTGYPYPDISALATDLVSTLTQSFSFGPNDQRPSDDWNLMLVNPHNPLPNDFAVTIGQSADGASVDQRCITDLDRMMNDCRAAGFQPVICSAYRNRQTQENLYLEQVQLLSQQGLSDEDARKQAGQSVALPGTSEHELGLAVDIVDQNMQDLSPAQATTATQTWLMSNSWRYGFVLRYQKEKTDLTSITYEPWHYRYVGEDAAKTMLDQNLCLEEYLGVRS